MVNMALAARVALRQLGAESLSAIAQRAYVHSSVARCFPSDDATSSSTATTADQQPPAARRQTPDASEQRQQSAVNRSQAQRRDSPAGVTRADSQQRPNFNRLAGSQQSHDRPPQGSFQTNRGSYLPSQRNDQQQQRPRTQPTGNPGLRRQQDRPQFPTAPAFRGQQDRPQFPTASAFRGQQQGRPGPPPGSSPQLRDPASGEGMSRQRPHFQQGNQPGPRQHAQAPPFRDQRQRTGPRTTLPAQDFPPFRDQKDRAAPRHFGPPQDFPSDPDDPIASDPQRSRKKMRFQGAQTGRGVTPSPTRREGGRPGASLRGGGPAKGPSAGLMDPSQALGFPAPMDPEDMDSMQEGDDADGPSENRLARSQHNPRGVPASWKDEIEDMDDQEDLDDARKISNMTRRLRSGDLVSEEQQFKNNIHTLQMNLDPRLDVELGMPVLEEMQAPTADDMLQMSGPLRQTMGIDNEQDWQEITEGLQEDFATLAEALRHGNNKARVQESTLDQFVTDTVPRDHPMFPVVSQSLAVLQHNPNWNSQKKSEFMWRLVKDLS